MSQYDTTVDPTEKNSSHTLVLELVGHDHDVLDVGCATGYVAEALVAQGCRVSGVEYDAEAAETARPHLKQLVVGDITQLDFVEAFGLASFDDLLFADVLEHVTEPEKVLRAALPLLRPGGSVVISVPNVTHGSVRLALLQGRWRYTETGLLDVTHVRFFDRDNFLTMLRDAGLQVTSFRATVLDPLGSEVEVDDGELPALIVDWVRRQPDAMNYQFVVKAVLGDPAAPVPAVVPAVGYPIVDDVHAEQAKLARRGVGDLDVLLPELMALRRRVLTLRDQAIGAAAEVGVAQVDAESSRLATQNAEADLERQKVRVAEMQQDLNAVRHDLAQLRGSLSWRLGNALVRPLARARSLGARR